MVKIAIDCLGTDRPLEEIVKGVYQASDIGDDLQLICFGPEKEIKSCLVNLGNKKNNIEVIAASYAITPQDNPIQAIRLNKEASMTKAFDYIKANKDVEGFCTCGSTSALIVGAIMNLNTIKIGDINCVPCLSALLPDKNGKLFSVVDCGANVECKPENLVGFAHLGAAFMQSYKGIDNPRVALISNGKEDSKGNALTKAAFALLKESNLNFIGNIEGTSVTEDLADVIVCDGFTGNVLLKNIEGTAKLIIKDIYKEMKVAEASGDSVGKAVLAKAITGLMNKYDFNTLAGATLLGVDKVIVKGHGAATSDTIVNIVKQAYVMIRNNYLGAFYNE